MGDPAPRPKLEDYDLATHGGQLTHTFRPTNPAAFDIKSVTPRFSQHKNFLNKSEFSHNGMSHFSKISNMNK